MKINLFFLIASVTLAGCHFGTGFTNIAPSIGSKTSPPNEEFMYLDLNESYYDNLGVEPPLYELNTTEEAGPSDRRDSVSNCEIFYDEEEPADPGLICILDYMEEEFLEYDLSIVFNVPKGMCSYLRWMPPWHYNRRMGHGPPVLCQVKETTGDGEEEETEESLCLPVGGACPTEITAGCSQDAEDLCPYIYARPNGEKLNCCLGNYTIIGTTDSGVESWGGNAQNCMGGPGRTSWSEYDENGYPAYLIDYILEDGLRITENIANLLEVAQGGAHSTPIANYIKDFDKPWEELEEDDSIEFPTFLRQEESVIARSGRPFYTFLCTDSAGDILHQINLMIREWNTYEEFMAFYESEGDDDSANPDVDGEEGDNCQYENRRLFGELIPEGYCNDYLDMDDIIESPAEYPRARYQ